MLRSQNGILELGDLKRRQLLRGAGVELYRAENHEHKDEESRLEHAARNQIKVTVLDILRE